MDFTVDSFHWNIFFFFTKVKIPVETDDGVFCDLSSVAGVLLFVLLLDFQYCELHKCKSIHLNFTVLRRQQRSQGWISS